MGLNLNTFLKIIYKKIKVPNPLTVSSGACEITTAEHKEQL